MKKCRRGNLSEFVISVGCWVPLIAATKAAAFLDKVVANDNILNGRDEKKDDCCAQMSVKSCFVGWFQSLKKLQNTYCILRV